MGFLGVSLRSCPMIFKATKTHLTKAARLIFCPTNVNSSIRVLDLDKVYRSVASPETVFERDNEPLQAGEPEFAVFLYLQKGKRTSLSQAGGDTSGNLGFTYGTQTNEKSTLGYLRVWVLRQSRWSLMFDVATSAK